MELVALGLGLGVAGLGIAIRNALRRRDSQGARPSGRETPESRMARLAAALKEAAFGHAARVAPYAFVEGDSGVRLVVEGLATRVGLRRPPVDEQGHRRAGAGLDTGDPVFDAAFESDGPLDHVLALFGSEVRAGLLGLLSGSVRVGEVALHAGELEVEVPTGGFLGEHPGLPEAVHAVGKLSRLLWAPEAVPERLAANARRDPLPKVRQACLGALARLHPDDALTLAALRAGTSDPDAGVRVEAARGLGPEGRAVLLSLATDGGVDDAWAALAIEALGPELQRADAEAQIDRALEPRAPDRTRSLCACLAGLGTRQDSEPALIRALAIPIPAVRVAAARALAAVGSAAAVLPLKEAVSLHRGELLGPGRNAIAEIQSRLSGSPGELSIAEGAKAAGSLSLADDPLGHVSFPEDAERRR